jgi:hypothetical protein
LFGAVIGFMVGLVIGAGWFFCLLAGRRWANRQSKNIREVWREIVFTVFYISALASSFASGYIAIQITRFVLCRSFM